MKERLEEFLKYLGISQRKFEMNCGLSNGFVDKVGYSIRKDKLDKIIDKYQNLNVNWLKTGVGRMLNGDAERGDAIYVSLLPISAQGGSLNEFTVAVKDGDCEKIISPIKGADWAITVSGDSMAPEYPSGAQILIKKINEKAFIDWGKVYVLDTCNGTVLKILVPSEKEGCVKCCSINTDERYAPFDVSFDDVFGVYRVLLCMSVK